MDQSINFTSKFLSDYLDSLIQKGNQLSLRGFAKKIKLSPGGLSQILSGQKRLSMDRAFLISQNLNLDEHDKKLFTLYAELDSAANFEKREDLIKEINALKIIKNKEYLNENNFSILDEWFYCAILECVSTYGSEYTLIELANHFSLDLKEIKKSIQVLINLNLIKIIENKFIRQKNHIGIKSNTPSKAFLNFYLKVNERINNSLKGSTQNRPIVSTQTFSYDSSKEDELKKATQEYLSKLQAISDASINKNNTYLATVNILKLGKS